MKTIDKMYYLENKFNAPMDIIMKAIRYSELNNIDIKTIKLEELINNIKL